jgi:spore germination protein KC
MTKFKLKVYICLLLSLLIMTGCWDMVEIDRRIFTGLLGIDTSSEEDKYTFYFSFPIAREIVGGEGGGGGGKAVGTATTVGSSIIDGARNLALRFNRDIYFEHMRIVVISENVARRDLKKIIDPFSRGTEFNRRSRIAICKGEVKKILEVEPWIEKLKAEYLESLYTGTGFSGKFIEVDLGDFLRSIHATKGNALVSRIEPNKTEVNIGGAGVIKDYRFVGWLGEEETQGVNFFLGKIKGGDIVGDDPHGNGTVTLTILGERSKLYLKTKELVPEFGLEVFVDCNVASMTHGNALDPKDIAHLEDLASRIVKAQISKGIKKLKEYKVDLLKLGDHLRKYEPVLWKKYEKDWQNTFPDVKIHITVHTTIKNIGVTR